MTKSIDNLPIKHYSAERITHMAYEAMLAEVFTHPKPGLVDPFHHAAHPDMNVFTFIRSANALRPYFREIYFYGESFKGDNLTQLMLAIRPVGKRAEKRMYEATHGVNTHKGAIFIMGIVLSALGYCNQNIDDITVGELVSTIKRMTNDLVKKDFTKSQNKKRSEMTAGEKEFVDYGTTGIRGEAQMGFLTVIKYGLPALVDSSGTHNRRYLIAFLNIVENSIDSNLIKRAGNDEIVTKVHREVKEIIDLPEPLGSLGMDKLDEMRREFENDHLSLGGSADLLILTIFLGKITKQV